MLAKISKCMLASEVLLKKSLLKYFLRLFQGLIHSIGLSLGKYLFILNKERRICGGLHNFIVKKNSKPFSTHLK